MEPQVGHQSQQAIEHPHVQQTIVDTQDSSFQSLIRGVLYVLPRPIPRSGCCFT